MFRIKFLNLASDQAFFWQWSRLKRRERVVSLFIVLALLLNLLSWLGWITVVAPSPLALSLPLSFDLGIFSFLRSYLWIIGGTLILLVNIYLIGLLKTKDLLATWLLLGATLLVQAVIFIVAASLAWLNLF